MSEKTYLKIVEHIKSRILSGEYMPGSRIPTERDLAAELGVSRNSVREGLRLLENVGVLSPMHGSGNYVSQNFDESIAETLSFMYVLKGIDEQQVLEFRAIIEEAAMKLAVQRIEDKEKKELLDLLNKLEKAGTEEERTVYDEQIHRVIVQASRNDFLIMNYNAFMGFMNTQIHSLRQRIIEGMESRNMLEKAHRHMVSGVVTGDIRLGMLGLHDHFGYVEKYRNI